MLDVAAVVTKIDSDYIEHFRRELIPMVYYVPASLGNMTQVVEYVLDKENEEEMKNINTFANMWCMRKMMAEGMAKYMMSQLEKYETSFKAMNISMTSLVSNDSIKDLVKCY